MEKQIIEAQKGFTLNENERLQMATLLIKAGYSVRIAKAKQDGKSTICLEYWK
ncbi:MAG: resolvase [Oscillospiraceae bacterium]|nr:resolvase [Oscillospiraceae bacterium]